MFFEKRILPSLVMLVLFLSLIWYESQYKLVDVYMYNTMDTSIVGYCIGNRNTVKQLNVDCNSILVLNLHRVF